MILLLSSSLLLLLLLFRILLKRIDNKDRLFIETNNSKLECILLKQFLTIICIDGEWYNAMEY
jgi:hypothetical protein